MDRIEEAKEWAAQGRRSIEVKIDNMDGSKEPEVKIWVYDYDLMVGQYVTSVAEIDLAKAKEQQERSEYQRLKAKFEEA